MDLSDDLIQTMTRHRFYASPEAFAANGSFVTLGRNETRHLRNVLRLSPGNELFVFDGKGNEYRCTLTAFTATSSTAEIIEQVPSQSQSTIELTLAVGLLKGDKFDLVVQKATELGVHSLQPTITARADVKIRNLEEAERKLGRWRRITQEAMKQCGRAHSMEIQPPVHFSQLISKSANYDSRLLFAERDGGSFERVIETADSPSRIVALVASEGGLSDQEIRAAEQAGWTIVTLAGRILRAETAAIVVATLLQHRFGDLK